MNIGVLVSGGGTNLQAVIDSMESGYIKNACIVTVVSNNQNAFALERAKSHGISSKYISRKQFNNSEEYSDVLIEHFQQCKVDLILLCGYMSILGEKIIKEFEGRIINIHPSLIPSFCGKGYYGLKVHENVLKYGVKITGATVHFVEIEPDAGPIILQKAVEVRDNDTPESLQRRVMEQAEWIILPQAVKLFTEGRLSIEGRRVFIDECSI